MMVSEEVLIQILGWQMNSSLVRISAVKGKGVFKNLLCRVLSIDANASLILLYDVDNKRVENLKLNEIDELIVA